MKVEVAVLGFPVHNSPNGLYGHKATFEEAIQRSELRSCGKVEVAVLGSRVPNSPYGLCGRKATLKKKKKKKKVHRSKLRSRLKVEAAVLGSLFLINLTVSLCEKQR